jgi:hypothetical protein
MKIQTRTIAVLALLITPLTALPAAAASVEVSVQLPQRARIDLRGRESLAVAPFLAASREETEDRLGRDVDVQRELARYLHTILRRETDLRILDAGPVEYPVWDLGRLAGDRDFWRALGERTGADLILAGAIDFDVQDRSGYRPEEYISPVDGRTYFRTVLVEEAGFEYDLLLHVYDGRTGELLYKDNFKDFQIFAEGEGTDPLEGMFRNLAALENRILNVFTTKRVEAARLLFTRASASR